MKLLRGSVWLKYLTSYLLVLALPFLAFSVFFGNYARRASMERLSDSMRRTTDQIQSSFDIRMEQINAIAGQISQRTEFDGISLSCNFAAYDVIRKALTGYVSTNLFCTEILYYNSSVPEVIFSSQGTYNPSYYRLLVDNAGEPQTFETYEWDQNRTGWVSSGQIINNRIQLPECLFYVIPLKNTHGGLLLFELSDVVIRKHLFENLPQGGQVFIMHGTKPLYPFHTDSRTQEVIQTLPSSAFENPAQIDGRLYVRATTTDTTGLTYIYTTSEEPLLGLIKDAMQWFTVLMFFLSVLCVTALSITSVRHARPIQQMVNIADAEYTGGAKVKQLPMVMERLFSRSMELDHERRQILREHAMIRLIRGRYLNDADALKSLAMLDMCFLQPYHCIALLRQADGQAISAQALFDSVCGRLSAMMDAYGFTYAEKGCFVFLLGTDSPDRQPLVSALKEVMEEIMPGVSVSLGESFSSLRQASMSFMQALIAGNSGKEAGISLFEPGEDAFFFPADELNALNEALQNADREKTIFLYDVLCNLLQAQRNQHFLCLSIVTGMINHYLTALHFMDPHLGARRDWYAFSISGSALSDLDEMQQYLAGLHKRILKLMAEKPLADASIDIHGIANYITATEELDTLTVSAVADRFGMTISALSHRFKERMGCNISDYILARKMAYACMMLRSTKTTVAEIAAKVGYTQYPSFVRQFKSHKRMTPSAYREQYQKRDG